MKRLAATIAGTTLALAACSSTSEPDTLTTETQAAATSSPTPTYVETGAEDAYLAQLKADGHTFYFQDDEIVEQGEGICSSLMRMVDLNAESSDGEPIGITSSAINTAELDMRINTDFSQEEREAIMISATDNLCPEAYDHMDEAAKSNTLYRYHLRD